MENGPRFVAEPRPSLQLLDFCRQWSSYARPQTWCRVTHERLMVFTLVGNPNGTRALPIIGCAARADSPRFRYPMCIHQLANRVMTRVLITEPTRLIS